MYATHMCTSGYLCMLLHVHVCRALVCVCHGVTEHLGRYYELGELLSDSGVLMFGHDHGIYMYICDVF